jgi:hypothetical protein
LLFRQAIETAAFSNQEEPKAVPRDPFNGNRGIADLGFELPGRRSAGITPVDSGDGLRADGEQRTIRTQSGAGRRLGEAGQLADEPRLSRPSQRRRRLERHRK